jgi:transposase-like protein
MAEGNVASEIAAPEPTVQLKRTDSKGRRIVPRREFDEAFKRAAVARAKKWKGQMVVLAREMDLHPTMLRRWMNGDLGEKAKAKPTKVAGVTKTPGGLTVYSDVFKRKAVERWNKGKETLDIICKDLKISTSMLSAWRRKLSPETAKKAQRRSHHAKHAVSPTAKIGVSKFSREEKLAVLARVAAGERITDIGAEIGVTPSGIDYWRRTLGGKIPRAYIKRAEGTKAVANALGVPFDATGGKVIPIPVTVRDAISFLRHAKDECTGMLQRGVIKEFDQAHLLAMMALNSLTK